MWLILVKHSEVTTNYNRDTPSYMWLIYFSMNGRSMCSRKLCENRVLKRAIEPSGCYYNGEWHEVGSTYTAEDGCNKCSCRFILIIVLLPSISFLSFVSYIFKFMLIKSRVRDTVFQKLIINMETNFLQPAHPNFRPTTEVYSVVDIKFQRQIMFYH